MSDFFHLVDVLPATPILGFFFICLLGFLEGSRNLGGFWVVAIDIAEQVYIIGLWANLFMGFDLDALDLPRSTCSAVVLFHCSSLAIQLCYSGSGKIMGFKRFWVSDWELILWLVVYYWVDRRKHELWRVLYPVPDFGCRCNFCFLEYHGCRICEKE